MSTSASSRERLGGARFGRLALLSALLLIVWPAAGLRAQEPEAGSGAGLEPLDTSCFATFVSGAAEDLVRICVSKHGNLMKFESPAGFEHLHQGILMEGYILCSDSTATRDGYDIGNAESGFDDGTVSQPGGAGTLPIIVTRNTLDGRFQLTQTFTWDPGNNQVFVEMQVKNVSGVKQLGVDLIRFADLDIVQKGAGGVPNNEWGVTLDSVFAWNDFGSITGTDAPQAVRLSAATRKTEHFAQVTGIFESSCSPVSVLTSPIKGDFAGRVTYSLGNVGKNGTKTATFTYRRF